MDRPVVLCGLGRVGWRVLDNLRAAGLPVSVVSLTDPDDPRLAGVRFLRGDCRRPDVLEKAGVKGARGVIILTSDDLVNVTAALTVRQLDPDVRVVVRMFNQNLIPRLGAAVRNTVALSVSALIAPLLALTALTGDSLGAFPLPGGPQQLAEIPVEPGSPLAGRPLRAVAAEAKLLVLGHRPAGGDYRLWDAVPGDTVLSPGDEFVACGAPDAAGPLLAGGRGELFAGVRWAGWVRRQLRTLRRTVAAIDLPVKIAGVVLFATIFASTLVFRAVGDSNLADAFYHAISVIATGSDMAGTNLPPEGKVFVGVLKIAGAALVAAFTAIFTQYLIRAKLGGAFEARRIPDGGHVVVCGLGNVGFRCVEELLALGTPVVAVDRVNDNPFAATVRRMGVAVIIGDATIPAVLAQARAGDARAVIAATDSELANLEIALLVRELNPAQRVVVRLTEPTFAEAVRSAADIKHAVSIPALAAPAFAAALLGDRILTLVTVGTRTVAIVELTVQPDDPCLKDVPLAAAMVDYRILPLAVSGKPPFAAEGVPATHRLQSGETLVAAVATEDMERLLRRAPATAPPAHDGKPDGR